MKIVLKTSAVALFTLLALALSSAANDPSNAKETSAMVIANSAQADAMRVQGEQRFHANCGRCHAAPHKFPPRIMATVVRHMRVRATITDQDMRLILFYMTE